MAQKLVFDRVLFATVLVLTFFGLVMVYSATAPLALDDGLNPLFLKQSVAALVGLAAMAAVTLFDYRRLSGPWLVYALVVGVVLLLGLVLTGPPLNNTRRWLFVGGVSIQPSELAKLVAILYVAYQIYRKAERLDSHAFLVPVISVLALLAGLIWAGRDHSTALLICLPPLLMVVIAGLSWKHLAAGGGILLPLAIAGVLTESYRIKRLVGFLNPEDDPLGSGFQLLQSLIAVGSGGLFGLGPGNSVQKLHFLPSPHADFIFSIVAEELGLLGALALVIGFGVLLWRGVLAGLRAPDDFGRYLAWGLTGLLVGQGLIHISVALGMLPPTGLPLPLISNGGSSLVTCLLACGLLLNVSQHGVSTLGLTSRAWIER